MATYQRPYRGSDDSRSRGRYDDGYSYSENRRYDDRYSSYDDYQDDRSYDRSYDRDDGRDYDRSYSRRYDQYDDYDARDMRDARNTRDRSYGRTYNSYQGSRSYESYDDDDYGYGPRYNARRSSTRYEYDDYDERYDARGSRSTTRSSTSDARSVWVARAAKVGSAILYGAKVAATYIAKGARAAAKWIAATYRAVGTTTLRKVLFIVIPLVVLALLIAGISSCAFVGSIGGRLNAQYNSDERLRGVLADQAEEALNLESNWTDMSPFYMLLVGVDSDENRIYGDEAELYGSEFRTDTMILARVDPGQKKVALVSIHRDTWVNIDGQEMKINSSYPLGGIAKTIEVVSRFAGVPITHYAEVNLDGFIDIVDALGGLWVDVPFEFTDSEEYSGAHFDAGPQLMSGEDAMYYVRVRHAYDDLGDGDRYRAANQRQVLELLLQRIMNASPGEMINLINIMANYVSTDFTLDQIVNLALAMRGIDVANDVYSTMNPTYPVYEDETWFEISDDEYWHQIMQEVDAGLEPSSDYQIMEGLGDLETGSGAAYSGISAGDQGYSPRITVRDATAHKNVSTRVADALDEEGWDATDMGPVSDFYSDITVVAYLDDRYAEQAWALATELNGIAEEAGTTWDIAEPYDIMVVLGGDWG